MPVGMLAAAGSAAGGSPPSTVLSALANDTEGRCTFGTGTSPSAGQLVKLVSGMSFTGYGVQPYQSLGVAVTPMNAATAALQLYVTIASDGRTISINAATAPAASQANTTYEFSYLIGGFPR